VQLTDAFVVSVLGSDLTKLHEVITVHREKVVKPVNIPVVEQCQVKTYMKRGKGLILLDALKEVV
jgi:hypothetical protein